VPDEATVAAYPSNRLEQTRAAASEAYFQDHADFAHEVELDLILKAGLRRKKAQETYHRTSRRRRVMPAIAASLTFAVGCGLWLRRSTPLGGRIAYLSAAEIPVLLLSVPRVSVTLIRQVQASTLHPIVAPQGAGAIVIRVAPDVPPGTAGYAIEVPPESGPTPRSATLDGLRPDADGYIEEYLPLTTLIGQMPT
jgi:hypothetical protein